MPRPLEEVPGAASLTPDSPEERMPQEARDGVTLRAAVQHWYGPRERLTAMLGYVVEDLSPVARAAEQADTMIAAIRAEADDQLAQRIEALAERQAAAKLAHAEQEMQAVEQRLQAARQSFESAVEQGHDPRRHRPALTTAETELEDVRTWRGKLADDLWGRQQKLAQVRQELLRERAAAQVAALAETRGRLKEKAEAVMREMLTELLLIDAAEKALAKV
jgi:hypothetical protein